LDRYKWSMTSLSIDPDRAYDPRRTNDELGPRRANPGLRDRRTGDLSQLFERRPDLRGVHAPADELAESMIWAV